METDRAVTFDSYDGALEAAGATVHLFKEFGSYQGTWVAQVTYEGRKAWVKGDYGSCSGCDALQAEFGYEPGRCDEHKYDYKGATGCPDCEAVYLSEVDRFKAFGREYLDGMMTQEEAEKSVGEYASWSIEDEEMLNFVKANPL